MASDNGKSFLDKFAEVSAKVGNQVHLRSLRDAFATITPLYILAGIAVLINNVVFPLFPLDAAGLANLQTWGSAITLGTLNVSAIILAGLIGYSLAKNKRFDNPLACVVVAISAFVIMMPQQITATLAATSPLLTDKITSAEVTGALSTANTGTNGLFSAIIIALLSVSLFIKISGIEKLKVKLGEGVPPAVSNSFNVMIRCCSTSRSSLLPHSARRMRRHRSVRHHLHVHLQPAQEHHERRSVGCYPHLHPC